MWSAPSKRVKYAVVATTALAFVSAGLATAALSGHANAAARDRLAQQNTAQTDLLGDVANPEATPTAQPKSDPLLGDPAQAPVGGPGAGPSASPPAATAPKPAPPAPKPKPKPKPKPPVPPATDNSVAQGLLVYINTKRAAKGLYPYKMSAGLVKAATLHSQCMASVQRISHLCKDEKPIGERFIGVPWRGASENAGQENASNTSASILAAAKRSTDAMLGEGPGGGHFENLMSNSSKLIGIGVVRTSNGKVWLTQDFVNPG
ncbi:MAG: hypothetical protein QOI07_3715 [Verrucomicrobiota bacterium]